MFPRAVYTAPRALSAIFFTICILSWKVSILDLTDSTPIAISGVQVQFIDPPPPAQTKLRAVRLISSPDWLRRGFLLQVSSSLPGWHGNFLLAGQQLGTFRIQQWHDDITTRKEAGAGTDCRAESLVSASSRSAAKDMVVFFGVFLLSMSLLGRFTFWLKP